MPDMRSSITYSFDVSGSRVLAILIALLLASATLVTYRVETAHAVAVTAGYRDHSYGSGVGAPTEDKPQSKVWFTDGSWWGGLFNDAANEYHIYRFNAGTQAWTDTGTVVDVRDSSHADYLWDAGTNSLFVASVNGDNDADPILVFKFTYAPASDTYTLDPDFRSNQDADPDLEPGLIVGQGPAETVTIAKDSTGQLWVTFQNDSLPGDITSPVNIMVNRSTTNEHTWGTPFSIGSAGPDDISAIVAFGGNAVGVMWSDQFPDGTTHFKFSAHADSQANDETWTTVDAMSGGLDFAEDHINLKLVATGSGEVLAAVKTNGGPNHIQVLRRNPGTGSFSAHVVVGAGQDVTRPQLVVDETNANVYVFYTAPESAGDGNQTIYYKSAPLSTLAFNSAGLGTAFIQDGANDINNIATSKHNVTSATGLLAIASSDTNTSYYHGWISLGAVANREVGRIWGANRFGTAAEISEARYPSPAGNIEVFVVTGLDFPDALTAGPAAGLKDAPVLLVRPGSIPPETDAELKRLGPAKIWIAGGPSVVSDTVKAQLQTYTDSKAASSVERLAGSNRYGTAQAVANLFAADRPSVFVATGLNFPDALAAGPAATKLGVPILLVKNTIPAETAAALNHLKPATIYVIGSNAVVSDSVKNALAQYTDSKSAGSVIRLSGPNRYATNVAVVQQFWTSKVSASVVANGLNFPDALAHGAYDLPLHLVRQNSIETVIANDIKRIDPDRIDALGSAGVVSEAVLNQLRAL